MIVVLDASAAVRAAMDPGAEFRSALESADLVFAPDLIVAEVCSAFQKYVRARVLSRAAAETSAGQALALVDKLHPLADLVAEVFALTARIESSVYDLFYLALARRTSARLLTADLALRSAASRIGVDT